MRQASAAGEIAVRAGAAGTAELVGPGSTRWQDALGRVPHDVYHLPGYAELDARTSGGEARALVYREQAGTMLLPLVLRQVPGSSSALDACSPYGYPGPVSDVPAADAGFWDRACSAVAGCLRAAGVISCFVRVHPLLPPPAEPLARHGALVQHGETVAIDLTRPEEELWSRTRANHRRQISRARRDGIVVRIGDERLTEFVEIYHQTMSRVGAGEYYFFDAEYFAGLQAALGPALHLVGVHERDEADSPMIGGGLFFEHAGLVQYHLGGTRDGYGRVQPTKVMFDEVRRWAKGRGCTDFHLGGGLGGRADDLFHFKAGFSDRHLPFHTWRLVTDSAAYTRLAGAHGVDDDYFPAYRRPPQPEESRSTS